MSEEPSNDMHVVTIEDLIATSAEKDFVSSDKIFAELMQNKIDNAMETEKIRVAGEIYNEMDPIGDEDQIEMDLEDDEEQLELDLEDEDA
jgi:hypothetical protein